MLRNWLNAVKAFLKGLFTEPTPSGKDEIFGPQDASELITNDAVIESDAIELEDIEKVNKPSLDNFDDDLFNKDGDKPWRPDPPQQPKVQRYMWCLDNGHGKLTPGKRSPLFDDNKTRFFEYEFNRDVVNRIAKKLKLLGIVHYITVPETNVDDFLEQRVNRANKLQSKLPKLFVSVHSNAAPAATSETWASASISGIETWHYHGSDKGQYLAGIFQKHLIVKTGWVNRKLKSKKEGQFYVLRNTNMTAILTENGFYNNKKQALDLMKPEVRQKIADAHVAAIQEIEREGIKG